MAKHVDSRPRIWADFCKPGGHSPRILILTTIGTSRDLSRLGIELHEGLEATFYDEDEAGNPEDVEVDGTVHFSTNHNAWVALVDFERASALS